MKIPRWAEIAFYTHIDIVRCSECGGKLTRPVERAAGISKRCHNKKVAEHANQQISETKELLYFFTTPYSKLPSPYFASLEDCIIAAGKRAGSKIWMGDYARPIPTPINEDGPEER